MRSPDTLVFALGSTNSLKRDGATRGAELAFPDRSIVVRSYDVESGVRAQPLGGDETRTGAFKRARNALACDTEANFGIGLESGIDRVEIGALPIRSLDYRFVGLVIGKVCVIDRNGTMGWSGIAETQISKTVAGGTMCGEELTDIVSRMYGEGVEETRDCIDVLTGGQVRAADLYAQATQLALTQFAHPELFE